MKYWGILHISKEMKKCLFYLSCLNLQLVIIAYSEPLRTTIHLKSLWKWYFERRFGDDAHLLSLVVGFFGLEDSDIDDTAGYDSSRDDNLSTIRSESESLSSEDEFIDTDIFEDIIFWHKKALLG